MCAGNEIFFVSLYLMKWVHTPISDSLPFLDIPPYFAYLASFTWPQLMALLSFLICVGKNIINVVQLWKASKILVGVDLAERAAAREKSE
jgi:CDP-diacylglycerol--inositol 3-phosphatidyltransferase